MLDIAIAYNRYAFLGSEFLLWLWFMTEVESETLFEEFGVNDQGVEIELKGDLIIANEQQDKPRSRVVYKSEDTFFKEARRTIIDGASIKEMHLNFKIDADEYTFIIIADSFDIKSLKVPKTQGPGHPEELEGHILERLYLDGVVLKLLDEMFMFFINYRVSEQWNMIAENMQKWLTETSA